MTFFSCSLPLTLLNIIQTLNNQHNLLKGLEKVKQKIKYQHDLEYMYKYFDRRLILTVILNNILSLFFVFPV